MPVAISATPTRMPAPATRRIAAPDTAGVLTSERRRPPSTSAAASEVQAPAA